MLHNKTTQQTSKSSEQSLLRRVLRVTCAAALTSVMLPLFIFNAVLSIATFRAPLKKQKWLDIGGEVVELYVWQAGVFKSSAMLFNITAGDIHFVGTPIIWGETTVPNVRRFKSPCAKAGVFDCLQLHSLTGLIAGDIPSLLASQSEQGAVKDLAMVLKILLCRCVYKDGGEKTAQSAVFGIPFDNANMEDAVNWVCASHTEANYCQVGYFLNANSINLAAKQQELRAVLTQSNKNFVDGSGMRLAARHAGINLADNINGTDMLPVLCRKAVETGGSFFLLGAKDGIAQKAGDALETQFPGLDIRGTHHGYFKDDNDIIEKINNSGATILLVALGSPRQEVWLAKNRHRLNCRCALAVGGLLDFFSGSIPRAPLWMRELGLEWIWRLMQEPTAKFSRYVIGNPVFLFRVYVLKQSIRGL
ncbi:WecB/TagA/CpsF family glycosyltransferase [Pseudoalteromonas luteoviolacea]|uniref:WecB/TagA/CpsF family glycosyltransferase n=1 Tax=Pseudoalteromonas luteoviolacea TaxID=43657 RepID=UPI001B395C7D|nr:WecB/TagA/CpsF family glycosyltransferase [Pseudoalteromonas luteoviolacea]MBQ4814407.1 WecB/TagA/CpsF family glycosyltransferase [Pseudoalteromonas luteoviolacea]